LLALNAEDSIEAVVLSVKPSIGDSSGVNYSGVSRRSDEIISDGAVELLVALGSFEVASIRERCRSSIRNKSVRCPLSCRVARVKPCSIVVIASK
jgi:hypothetical protein